MGSRRGAVAAEAVGAGAALGRAGRSPGRRRSRCAFRQALYLLKAEAKHGRSLELSADEKDRMTAATFARLSGQIGLLDPSLVTPVFAPKRGQPQGTLDSKSISGLFGWRSCSNGSRWRPWWGAAARSTPRSFGRCC